MKILACLLLHRHLEWSVFSILAIIIGVYLISHCSFQLHFHKTNGASFHLLILHLLLQNLCIFNYFVLFWGMGIFLSCRVLRVLYIYSTQVFHQIFDLQILVEYIEWSGAKAVMKLTQKVRTNPNSSTFIKCIKFEREEQSWRTNTNGFQTTQVDVVIVWK